MKTIVVDERSKGPPRKATLELPAGWYRVLSGAIKPGDRILDFNPFWQRGAVQWVELTEFPPPGRPFGTADWYCCLIRRGEPVEVLCPRCHLAPCRQGFRYCKTCSCEVVDEVRRRQRPPRGKGKGGS
jgi:hypothetical protein